MTLSYDQRDIFPTCLELRRIDPAQNMKRLYLLQVQPDLFGGTSLISEWKRIGSRGRILVEHHANEGQAISAFLSRARIKGDAATPDSCFGFLVFGRQPPRGA